jgi:hypothetical protein
MLSILLVLLACGGEGADVAATPATAPAADAAAPAAAAPAAAAPAAAAPAAAAPATAPAAAPPGDPDAAAVDRGAKPTGKGPVADVERVSYKMAVSFEPAVTKPGGTLFYAGFKGLDDATGFPTSDAAPVDTGKVASGVAAFPITKPVRLGKDLNYFVVYGFGDHPSPGDRVASIPSGEQGATLEVVVRGLTIP